MSALIRGYQVAVTNQPIGDELVRLEHLVQSCDWREQSFNEIILNRGLLYTVRTLQGELIAYLLLQDQTDVHEVIQISVHPNYRQQGIASHLLSLAMTDIEQTTSEGIFLEVRESNVSAIALYQKLGFSVVGKRKNYYPTTNNERENALLMRFDLF